MRKREREAVLVNEFKKALKLIENTDSGAKRQTDRQTVGQTNKHGMERQRAAAHLTFPTNARRRSSGFASFHSNVNSIKSYQVGAGNG